MPKVCEPCGFYSTENTPTACPTCGSGLRFTLLPPRGQAAEPLPDAGPTLDAPTATALARRRKEGFLESLGITEINPRYLWIGFLVIVSVSGFFARQYVAGQRLKEVRPGMHISEAARLIDTNDDEGYYNSDMIRFRDNFSPNDRSSGTFEYEDGPHHMVIQWHNGILTRVENKGASGGGLRRSGTISIIDGGD
jgi:hypothetical protein